MARFGVGNLVASASFRGEAWRAVLSRLSQLWQIPLFIVSLLLFGYSAWLFINPSTWATIDEKTDVARKYLAQDRPDAAWQQLVRILETESLPKDKEATVHLLLGQAMEAIEKQKKVNIPADYGRIIEQTELAIRQGATATADVHRRLGDSYAALGEPSPAIDNYRRAIALGGADMLSTLRKLIELQLAQEESGPADSSLQDYLKQPGLSDAERAWALDQRAGLLIDNKNFDQARSLLNQAAALDADPVDQGQFNYQLGYCAYRQGQDEDAERYFRLARDQLKVGHPLDADAAYYLGRVYEDRNDPITAISFYQAVLTSHPESRVAPLARLGRGVSRIMQKDTDAGLSDLHVLTTEMQAKPIGSRATADALEALRRAEQLVTDRQDYQSALEVLAYEQALQQTPPPEFYARLGHVFEERADQIAATIPTASSSDQIRRGQQVSQDRGKAGDAFIIYSRDLTMSDDKAYADALWKGIDLYDAAGDLQAAIAALELFVSDRPNDRLAPDALLRLGRAYQAAGMFDKAIDAFQRNQLRYPKSLAASKSAVPLAQAYIAKGPEYYGKAERTLLGVVENNPLVDPSAEEFRQSLWELAQLYYRTGRYEQAIARLDEMAQRYPDDRLRPQMVFIMGDSYRKSADLLDQRLATASTLPSGASDVAEAAAARRDRLLKAKGLYDQVIDRYHTTAPDTDMDRLYQKLASFYRADCVYDLGDYAEAIRLYDSAAFSYPNDPSALAAYVQIVNAYFALGKPDEARAANSRAMWMLQQMPPEAFADGTIPMSKKYWQQWLQWTNQSGMW